MLHRKRERKREKERKREEEKEGERERCNDVTYAMAGTRHGRVATENWSNAAEEK